MVSLQGGYLMNEKFFELAEEKDHHIINGALEVFAKHDYKLAITDDIATKAGISKGLLFYYFHNKKALYTYLFEYTRAFLEKEIVNENYVQIEDFFEVLTYAGSIKYRIFIKNPYLLTFSKKVLMSSDEEAGTEIRKQITEYINQMFTRFFAHINLTKYREGVDPMQLMRMLTWMGEGYLFEYQQAGKNLTLDEIMKEFKEWMAMFRKIAYKEEWQ
jgi:AcrR family transcriptional regulator